MPPEVEERLELLLGLPRPDQGAAQRALALALAAQPDEAAGRRSRVRVLVPAVMLALVLLGVAAAALAETGTIHVSLGLRASARPEPRPQLQVPPGANAVAAVVDHELWLTTRGGLRIQGLPVRSATLSPHALYVAAGIGDSLVAMAPDGSRAWSHPAGGPVVAIAWAPDGLRIAYVVRRGGRFQLWTIEGNGIDDRLLDASVRPVTPSWRADSLAVAYVGAGGVPVVYDFGHDSHRVMSSGVTGATQVAFAPRGTTLAAGSRTRVWLLRGGRAAPVTGLGRCTSCDIGWARGRLIVASSGRGGAGPLQVFDVLRDGRAEAAAPLAVSGRLEALDSDGSSVVLAVTRPGSATRVLASAGGQAPEVLLQLQPGARVDALSVR